MSEFHKIWIDQCAATDGIRERFGVNDSLRYLAGEKLLRFMEVSHERPDFAAELQQFANRIRELFDTHEIVSFFAAMEAGEIPDPAKVDWLVEAGFAHRPLLIALNAEWGSGADGGWNPGPLRETIRRLTELPDLATWREPGSPHRLPAVACAGRQTRCRRR
jgi:hypothetical protein